MTTTAQRNIDNRGVSSTVAHRVVTPSDSEDLPGGVTRQLYVNATSDGNAAAVAMIDDSGLTITKNLEPYTYHAMRVRRVLATGTAAGVVLIAEY